MTETRRHDDTFSGDIKKNWKFYSSIIGIIFISGVMWANTSNAEKKNADDHKKFEMRIELLENTTAQFAVIQEQIRQLQEQVTTTQHDIKEILRAVK